MINNILKLLRSEGYHVTFKNITIQNKDIKTRTTLIFLERSNYIY